MKNKQQTGLLAYDPATRLATIHEDDLRALVNIAVGFSNELREQIFKLQTTPAPHNESATSWGEKQNRLQLQLRFIEAKLKEINFI